MNRKNLTAAVLAGLAGAAGIVGSAQAVNINPDGLGQVLIYPYYTTNGGNTTVISVVNTNDEAKAVKVRFLEGENSREVLDFNLYMSAFDVWTAALYDNAGTPTMVTHDTSCTVPYFYDAVAGKGVQEFLPWAMNDTHFQDVDNEGDPRYDAYDDDDNLDPDSFGDISRAAEGHFEMIEMGALIDDVTDNIDWVDPDWADQGPLFHPYCDSDATASLGNPVHLCQLPNLAGDRNWTEAELAEEESELTEGSAAAVTHDENGVPANCGQLVDAWTDALTEDKDGDPVNGYWVDTPMVDISAPSGGLFGGAAIVDVSGGAMYSYDAKAIDAFVPVSLRDRVVRGDRLHQEPGTILPSLDSGGNATGIVFVNGEAMVSEGLDRGVDAVSYVFMHDQIMNEYTTQGIVGAGTEWVLTFPTKQFYVHQNFLDDYEVIFRSGDADNAPDAVVVPFTTTWTWTDTTYECAEDDEGCDDDEKVVKKEGSVDRACEAVELNTIWDREEQTIIPGDAPPGTPTPPIVSPAPPPPPGGTTPGIITFNLCYETSVIEFGPANGDTTAILGSSNFHNIDNTEIGEFGWARLDFLDGSQDLDQDGDLDIVGNREPLGDFDTGLLGLPVTGFAVQNFANSFLGDGADVLANYGGIFQHKATRKLASIGDYLGDS